MIGKGIIAIRKKKGLTQEDLALKVNTSQSYLSLIEIGHKRPSLEMIDKIAEALETESELIFWFGVTRDDVPEENRNLFDILKPSIDSMMLKLFYR